MRLSECRGVLRRGAPLHAGPLALVEVTCRSCGEVLFPAATFLFGAMLPPMSKPPRHRNSEPSRPSAAAENRRSVVLAIDGYEWLSSLLVAEGLDATLFTVPRMWTRMRRTRRNALRQLLDVWLAIRASSVAHDRRAVLVCSGAGLTPAAVVALLGFVRASKRVPLVALNVIVFPASRIRGLLRDRVYRALWARVPLWASVSSEWLRQSAVNAYGFSPDRIRVLSDCWLPRWMERAAEPTPIDSGYVFSGGAAARDWETVVETARACPAIPFRVIAGRADWPAHLDVPDNLQVTFDTSPDYFWESARHARVSVVSLASNVTSGLVVLMLTSLMGRPVVCTRTAATEPYYPAQCSEMLIEPRDHAGMARAVESLWVDQQRRLDLARALQSHIMSTHSPESYARGLAEIISSTTG